MRARHGRRRVPVESYSTRRLALTRLRPALPARVEAGRRVRRARFEAVDVLWREAIAVEPSRRSAHAVVERRVDRIERPLELRDDHDAVAAAFAAPSSAITRSLPTDAAAGGGGGGRRRRRWRPTTARRRRGSRRRGRPSSATSSVASSPPDDRRRGGGDRLQRHRLLGRELTLVVEQRVLVLPELRGASASRRRARCAAAARR